MFIRDTDQCRRCTHPRSEHTHLREGTDCGRGDCDRFLRRWRFWPFW